jgi:hypothetical protein
MGVPAITKLISQQPIAQCVEPYTAPAGVHRVLDNFQLAEPVKSGHGTPLTIFDFVTGCAEPTEDITDNGDAGVPDSFEPAIYVTSGYNYAEENRISEIQTPENCPSVFYVHVLYRTGENDPQAVLNCHPLSDDNTTIVKINAPDPTGWPDHDIRRDVYQITWTPHVSGPTDLRFSAAVLQNDEFSDIENTVRLTGTPDDACPDPDEVAGPPPVVDIPALDNGMLEVREGETASLEFTLNQEMGAGYTPALQLVGPDENGNMVEMDLPARAEITASGNGRFRFNWPTNYTDGGDIDNRGKLYYFQIILEDAQGNITTPEGFRPETIQVRVRNNSTPQFLPVDQENDEIILPPIWEGDSIDWKLIFGDLDDDIDLGIPDEVQVLIDSGHIQRQSVEAIGDDAFPLMDDQTEQFIWQTQIGDGGEPYRFIFTLDDGVNPPVIRTVVVTVLEGPPDHDGDGYPAGNETGAGFDCDDNNRHAYPPGPSAYELANPNFNRAALYQQPIPESVNFCPGTVRGVQLLIDTRGRQRDEGITVGAIGGVHFDNSGHPDQPAVIITDRVRLTGLSVSGTTQAPAFRIVGGEEALVDRVQLEGIRIEHTLIGIQVDGARDLAINGASCFDTESCVVIQNTDGALISGLNVLQANNGVSVSDSQNIRIGGEGAANFNTLDSVTATGIRFTDSGGRIMNTGVVGAQPAGQTGIEIRNSDVDMSGVTATNFDIGFLLNQIANPSTISGLNAFGNRVGALLNNAENQSFDNGTIQDNDTGLEIQACGANANTYTGMRIGRNRIMNLNIPNNGQCAQERLNINTGAGNRVGN